MKRGRLCLLAVAVGAAIALGGCGVSTASQDAENEPRTDAVSETVDGAENLNDETTPGEEAGEHNILIAYFTSNLVICQEGIEKDFLEKG